MIIDDYAVTTWNNFTKKYYIELGYTFTKTGDEFLVKVKHLKSSSDVMVKFLCDYCNGEHQIKESQYYKEYKNIIKSRKHTNKDCCGDRRCIDKKKQETNQSKKPTLELSLAFLYPNLLSEWSNKNEKTPYDYFSKSHQKVWWKCKKCNHEYDMKISDRTHLGANCPYCSGKRVNESNSLANIRPDLSLEWNYDKNDLTPNEVTLSSNKIVWWKCEKGHEWETSVNNRTNGGTNCPYCAGNKVCLENCLSTKHPALASEWHPINNGDLTPYEVTSGTHQKVWWKCKKCNHEWKSSLSSRVYGSGCPACNESKGEKKIRKWLDENNIIFESQYEFNGLYGIKGQLLKFDFAILNNDKSVKLLIEYDGEFHFRKIFKEDGYERLKEHDRRKNDYCYINGIKLIRIPYWEFDRIEEILSSQLRK